ncbi:ABC transporter ATP-binding protein [Vulgatibacter sp.]|uniref:ABC transporter ATP-binding protein n=1 Tax=Vulgatibacter sp. TaxID=1971226 RepID=UPI003566A020
MTPILETVELTKTYKVGFRRRDLTAVKQLSLSVSAGEIFGFLGPNGAGKSTTIKMLVGLTYPTSGGASIFGHRIPSRKGRERMGFLPEHPYFHDFLTPWEVLALAGRLCGLSTATLRERSAKLLELVGLQAAQDLPLRRFSKGMLQRIGIAQALINDPDLVILDEPMSGLDPMGRKDVREIIFRLKEEGKTVFFSTHILSDVEAICDRVGLMLGGELREMGRLDSLLSANTRGIDVVVAALPPALAATIGELAKRTVPKGDATSLSFETEDTADRAIGLLASAGLRIVSVNRHRETLEDLYVRRANETGTAKPRGPSLHPTS